MNLFTVIYLTTSVLLTALAMIVFLNRKDRTSYSFIMLVSGMLGWVITLWLYYEVATQDNILVIGRFNFLTAVALAPALVFFARNYPESDKSNRSHVVFWTIILAETLLMSFITQFTPLIVESEIIEAENRIPVYGPLYFMFVAHFLFFVFYSLRILFFKYRSAIRGDDMRLRNQMRILVNSLLFAIVFGTTTSVVIPIIFTALDYLESPLYFLSQNLAPISTLIFASGITYSILRHRFLDVRVLLGRVTYQLLMSIITFAYLLFSIGIDLYLFGTLAAPAPIVILALLSIGYVSLFNEINNFIQNQVTSRLINPGFDPIKTSESLSNELSVTLDLKTIAAKFINTVSRTIRPNAAWVIIKQEESGIRVFPEDDKQVTQIETLYSTSVLLWQSVGLVPIIFDRLDLETKEGVLRNVPNLVDSIKTIMSENAIRLIMPMNSEKEVIGMYMFGEKEADSNYTVTEVEFITNITRNVNSAIERSLLYTEVQEFAETLQGKVDDATKDLQEANENLQNTLTQLQEIRRRERDMIDVMGHELRTPMSIVRNALSLLEREYQRTNGEIEPEKLKRYLEMGVESAKREVTLIETLLSATKVDASRIQLHLVKSDFKDVVHDAIQAQNTFIQEKGLELKYSPPAHDIFVYCDRTRVQQIMDNFLSNAAKYTQEGHIEIKIWNTDQFGWISIKDSGIGIDSHDIKNLGKKFFRAKQYISKDGEQNEKIIRPGGTGLGLYVTFELIRIMGGELYINSIVNQGTTFTWSMPIYRGQEEEQIDQTFDNGKTEQRSHIVINGEPPAPPTA